MSATTETLLDRIEQFLRDYYKTEICDLARSYPNDTESLWIDYSDIYRYDPDIATDLQRQPTEILSRFEEAVPLVDIPIDISLDDVDVRITDLPDPHVYSPGDIRNEQGGSYIGVSGVLERVTSTSDMPETTVFECQRCGTPNEIPQSLSSGRMQEPHECTGCDRQGPFEIDHTQSTWSD
jgi:replicative DNA helicase Mcm